MIGAFYTVHRFGPVAVVTRRASFDGILVVVARRWFVGRDARARAYHHVKRTRP